MHQPNYFSQYERGVLVSDCDGSRWHFDPDDHASRRRAVSEAMAHNTKIAERYTAETGLQPMPKAVREFMRSQHGAV